MATPVPVVSMMYFFVSTPPKTVTALSPTLSAMSTKFAICGGVLGGCRVAGSCAGTRPANKERRSPRLTLEFLAFAWEKSACPADLIINSTSYGARKARSRRPGFDDSSSGLTFRGHLPFRQKEIAQQIALGGGWFFVGRGGELYGSLGIP